MVKFDVDDKKLVCSFSGRLDSANCIKWEERLREKIQEAKRPVVFDLEKVNYIASGFLRICLWTAKEIKPEKLLIANACSYVKKVFKVSNLDRQLNIK